MPCTCPPSKSEASFRLARAEMASYHYPMEELGKPVQAMRPEKRKGLDNFIDTLRGFACKWGPSVAPMSREERRMSELIRVYSLGTITSETHRTIRGHPFILTDLREFG